MIDTDNVVHFQSKNDLHRLFAPGVIEKHERVTWIEVALALLFYVLGAALMAALFAFGAWLAGSLIGWLSSLDLSALTHIAGGKS